MELTPIDTSMAMYEANKTKLPDENEDLREAAEKFEAIFLHQFLKEARKTKLADDLFGSHAKSTYEDMLDQEHADIMSKKIDLGIAEALVRQFDKSAM
ncbi:rod-binding protein [Candidatus Puniceispirillum sp.]|uniref:rod-binding protein n=1 Tax=Candidatus Puniceispirillum sp. TaxID=2026719 RepID=UPI003F69B539